MENLPGKDATQGDDFSSAPSAQIEKSEPRQKNNPSLMVIAIIISAAILVFGCICFGLSFALVDKIPALVGMSVGAKPPAGANPLDYLEVRPGDFKCTSDDSGGIVVEGDVTNNSAYSIYDVVVKASLINKKGNEVSGNAAYFSGTVVYPHSNKPFKINTDDPRETYTCQVKIVRASFTLNPGRPLVPEEY